MKQDKTVVAYHEAGHIVAAIALGWRIRKASLRETRETLGSVITRSPRIKPHGYRWPDPGMGNAIIALGGIFSELLHRPRTPKQIRRACDEEWSDDIEMAYRALHRAARPMRSVGIARAQAAQIIGENKGMVRVFAKALLKHKHLTAAQIERIMTS